MPPPSSPPEPQRRHGLALLCCIALPIGIGLLMLSRPWADRAPVGPPPTLPLPNGSVTSVAALSAPVADPGSVVPATPTADQEHPATPAPVVHSPGAASAAPRSSTLVLPEPSPQSRQLIEGLTGANPFANGASADAIAQWKDTHQQLVQQGAAAVPAIWEFLQRQTDVQFGTDGWQSLGYRSGREAMIDALQQIGGPEALAVTREALLGAESPREIALLAKSLEAQAPEAYRAEVLTAARESLARTTQGDLENRDVGPIFEVFEKYGGPEAVGDLEQAAKQWRYYATLTLGQLPDGVGIPTLARMASEATNPSIPVLDTLASLATRYDEARTALLEQVSANRIPDPTWPALVQPLTGDEMQVADSVFDRVVSRITGEEYSSTHIGSGNQNFYWAPTVDSLTPEQIARQTALIDAIQAAAGTNPAAAQALQQARTVLERRLARVQAGPNVRPP